MTIQAAGNRETLACNGGTTVFPVNLQAYLASDFEVILTAPAASGGGQTLLVLNSDYSLTATGSLSPTYWTLTTLDANPWGNGYTLTVIANPTQVQQTVYTQGQPFPSLAVQTNLDRLTQMVQRLQDQISRAPHTPDGDVNPLMLLPIATARALTNMGFDVNGNVSCSVALASGTLSAASIGAFIGPQTPAEISAGIVPTYTYFPEGDIRRYGALASVSDNSNAINQALSVSGAGGAAAYIPGGTWKIANPLIAVPGSSMYGAGTSSVILAANGVDGLQFTSSDSGIIPRSRFFSNFQIIGTLSGTTNNAHGIYINTGIVSHAKFENLSILNFEYGAYVTGLYYSTFLGCFIQNCWYGIYFNNQSINVYVLDCTIQLTSASTVITNSGSYSVGIFVQGSPEVEGLHIQGGSLYGYNYALYFGLIFEVQVNAVDISDSTVCPIYFSSTLGGLTIRDSWIELGAAASGAFNYSQPVGGGGLVYGSGNLCGVFIAAITPSVNAKVRVEGNTINADAQYAGSCGVFVGTGNIGTSVIDNAIQCFDVGISGGATAVTTPTSGCTAQGLVAKFNRINIFNTSAGVTVYSASSNPIVLNGLGSDFEIGYNNIVPGAGQAATIAATSSIAVTTASAFPVGTPVQCTATLAGGPTPGVTYYVISSAGAAVTIGAYPGAAAIAWTGTGSIGNLIQTPAPWVSGGSGTPAGMSFYGRGQFLMVLSGMTTTVQGVCDWVANGKMVAVNVNYTTNLTGVSNATTMTGAGVPAFLLPYSSQQFLAAVENNGTYAYGQGALLTNGTLTFYPSANGGAFTASGNKGLNTQPMIWLYS
jgi:hypothetical protein